ncbi:MAG: hypothetical protein WD751_08995 [Anaerolineales bacterium]
MPLAVEGGINFLRFPGGDWGDDNDITHLQLDNFISLARQLGAEPSISVRLRGGTPEMAADLVRYANVEKGYAVKYWSIGNEPALYGDYDTLRYNLEWRDMALAMLAVDEDILLIGPEITQYRGDPLLDPMDANGKLWMDEFLRANGDLVDVVSVHRYPFPETMASGPASIDELRVNSAEWDVILPQLKSLICAETGRSIPLAVTEFNSHWNAVTSGEATPDSHFNAIWLADVLGRMIQHDVSIVNQFALQSASDNGGWGLFSRVEPRPSYYVFLMYQHLGTELVSGNSGVELVSVYPTLTRDGRLSILIVNLDSQEHEIPLIIEHAKAGEAQHWLFDESHQAESMGIVDIDSGGSFLAPPTSMSVLIFTGR